MVDGTRKELMTKEWFKKNIDMEDGCEVGVGGGAEVVSKDNIALIDMDGTVAGYVESLEAELKKLAGPEEPTHNINWNDRLPEHIWNRVEMIKNSKDWWLNLPKLEDGFTLLNLAIKIGFEIHVLTKGPKATKTAWTQKVEWCERHLPEDTNVTITHDKSLVYGRILIDDYPDYATAWLSNRPRGLVVMPLRDWNKDFRHPNVIHYDCALKSNNLHEVKDRMQEQYNRK
jgi:5'-nucleotidase